MDKERIRWACRRGMLELDLFLIPFFDEFYDHLSIEEQKTFQNLLTESDTDLQQWFLDQKISDNEHQQALIKKIRDTKQRVSSSPLA